MRSLKRLSAHLVFFVVVMSGFAAVTDVWRTLDYSVYRRFYLPQHVAFSKKVALVDLPRHRDQEERSDPSRFRERLADLLHQFLGPQRPEAVVLDVEISNDPRGLEDLMAALERLQEQPVKVYAVVGLLDSNGDLLDEPNWAVHAERMYRERLAGFGHTIIRSNRGVLSYQTKSGSLLALPVKVIMDHDGREEPPAQSLILPLADTLGVESQTHRFEHDVGVTARGVFRHGAGPAPDFSGRIVVVGSLEEDRPKGEAVAGPIMVASAISDQLLGGVSIRPLDRPALLIVQILIFAALTAAAFALLFQYVTRLQTRPVLTASLSVVIAVAGLAGAAAAGRLLKIATPVGLTLFAIVLTGALAWHFALKFLVTGLAEGSGKYDVFISYSRQQGDWVVANLLEPLKAMRKSDGSPLAIFFDRESIGIGEVFTTKYMWAIVDSRYFIPVFSSEYYGKNHCRNEMDLAYKRSVEKRVTILPVALTIDAVPAIYSHLNILVANANPAFIEGIRKPLLSSDPPVPA